MRTLYIFRSYLRREYAGIANLYTLLEAGYMFNFRILGFLRFQGTKLTAKDRL